MSRGGQQVQTYPFFTCSVETQKSKTFSFKTDSIIISTRGIFHAKFCREKFEASNNVFILSEKYPKIQYFLLLNLQEKMKTRNYISFGTTVNQLNPKELKSFQILVPDQKILEKFNNICEDIQLKIEKLTKKIENSERIRAKLLDKLFSKKLKIKNEWIWKK